MSLLIFPSKLPRSAALLLTLGALASCGKEAPPPAPPAARPVAEEVVPDAPYCARPVEKTAFDVAALKTRLMIAGLACGNGDKYNGFVVHNRSALVGQEKNLSGYFARNYGKSGQKAQDDYITQLANLQAQRRTRDAEAFCRDTSGLFDQAGTLKTAGELTALAATQQGAQPMKVSECK
jgi:predicted small lipoprotein YifL